MAKPTNFTTQLGAVVLTYVTHYWVMAGIAAWLLIAVAPQIFAAAPDNLAFNKAARSVSVVLGMTLLFGSILVAPQVKAQFGHPRAALTPNFAGPHLLVLAAVVAGFTLFLPLVTAIAVDLAPLGTIALAFAVTAPMLFTAHTNRLLGGLISLGAFYTTLSTWGMNWWLSPAGGHEFIHVAIILMGVALVAVWLYRLAHLREEMDDYQSFMMWPQSRKAGTEVSEQRRAVAASLRRQPLIAWLTDERLKQIGGFHGHRLLAVARLLKFGFQHQAFVQGLWTVIWFGGMTLFLSRFAFDNNKASGATFGASTFYLQVALGFPGMLCGEWLARRRPRTSAEMLLPLSRVEYIDGLLAAAIGSAATFWCVVNFGLAVVTYAAVGDQLTLPSLATMLLLTGSGAIGTPASHCVHPFGRHSSSGSQ
jgi:hypothetical protein